MSLTLNPTIQQHIVHKHTQFQDSSFYSSWENFYTKPKILRNYGLTGRPNQVYPDFFKAGYNDIAVSAIYCF